METLIKSKTNLRKQIKVLLKGIEPEKKRMWNRSVCDRLFEFPEMEKAETVYAYMALSWETGTGDILNRLWERGVKVALPKVLGSEMEFFEVQSMEDLEPGSFRIMEPKGECPQVNWPDSVILVPGLAFTRDGKRLGKGGGFYDKYLERYPGHKSIALAYEFQVVPDLPVAPHDRTVDILVTEKEQYICRK